MSENRTHIDKKYTWDLTTIFPSDEAWEAELAELSAAVADASRFQGHLADSAASLLEITDAQQALARRIEKLYVYSSMSNDQDTTVPRYQEFRSKALALYAQFGGVFAFYEPEFMALSEETLAGFMAEEAGLELYRHYFDSLLQQKNHILSQAEEELLAGASEIFNSPSETFSILDNADIVFPYVPDGSGDLVELTHGNYIKFMENPDREIRREAYEAMYSVYDQYQHTYAKTLQSNVKVQNFKARVRKYDSARHAALSNNFIPESVFETLVEAVNKNLPLLHRYLKLRKDILGVDELTMYDMYAPLSSEKLEITYEEALTKGQEVLAVLGEDYAQKVKTSFTDRWIDVYENKGKRSGAYSGGAYDTNAFMLLNWQDNLSNFYTLVHEAGHSMHSMYTRETQPYVYGSYSIFLAEIASTTNENILTEALLQEVTDEKKRFAILNNYLEGFRGTIFRQTQFAEFEHAIHVADQNGEVLTSDFLNNLYADLNTKYYGVDKEKNPQIQYEWARIPHFYYNYYVYQYATGFAAANFLADKIVYGTQEDKDKYLDYLKAGSSDYPLNVIKKAGVDMEKVDYLDAAFAVFERRLTELEELVAKGVHK